MKIIDGKQKKKWKVLELFITSVGWTIMLGLAAQIIFSLFIWAFNLSNIYQQLIILGNIEDSIFIMSTTVGIACGAFVVMYLWGRYNWRKYGPLDRRKFPKEVSAEDIAEYFSLALSEVEKFQSEKYIVLEENINMPNSKRSER